jgi:hypothetical protein
VLWEGFKKKSKEQCIMGYHLSCHTSSTKEQTAYPLFFLVSYILFISSAFPSSTPPLFYIPPPQHPLFYKRKKPPTFSFSFQLQIYVHVFFCTQRFVCFILLSISSFNCTPSQQVHILCHFFTYHCPFFYVPCIFRVFL